MYSKFWYDIIERKLKFVYNVFIKYKDNNINHAHLDKLNIEIKSNNDFLTHDLFTSGYGSDILKKFYKKSYSHNTVVIDGKNQNLECKLIIEFYNDNLINVRVNGLYDKVNITRRTQLLSNKIIDKIEVNHYNSKNIDYF